MKIIHINLSSSWRGGERQVYLLMQGLRERKVEQLLICKKDSALEARCKKESLQVFAISGILSTATFRFMKNLEKKGFNIIHCHESKGHTLGILYKLLSGSQAKFVLHRRVLFPIRQKLTTGIKFSSKYVSKIICISAAVEQVVKQSLQSRNTVVIPSMISMASAVPPSGVLRKDFGIKAETIIGYVAALTYEKDHLTFLDTAKLLLDSGQQNLHFVIIGEGKLRAELSLYAEKLELQQHLTFTGFLSGIEKIIPEIDILLFTSVSEGLGSTILDFFVAKRPVVCVRNGGSEELIFEGKTGFICEKGDVKCLSEKVETLLQNPEKVKEITGNAYNFVQENFSIEKVTGQTIEVYRQLN